MTVLKNEELEYKVYLLASVISDICDHVGIQNRETFLLKYNISLDETHCIDIAFKRVVTSGGMTKESFKSLLEKLMDQNLSMNMIQELIDVYSDYQPKAISLIK